ncbi:hypothetical protein [Nocardia tengchongensis]
MTDYLRPMAAYVATLGGHHDHHGPTRVSTPYTTADTPDIHADTTADDADSSADRGWTR